MILFAGMIEFVNYIYIYIYILGDFHFASATARHQERLDHDIARHIHGVLKVALHFVEHVLARASQYDRARLGIRALLDVGVVFLAYLADLEEATARADVFFADLVRSIDDGGAARARHSIIVGFAKTSQRRDVSFQQVVLR